MQCAENFSMLSVDFRNALVGGAGEFSGEGD